MSLRENYHTHTHTLIFVRGLSAKVLLACHGGIVAGTCYSRGGFRV